MVDEEPKKTNIFAFRSGAPIAPPHEPMPHVIERLEWLLERAKAGEIQGIAAAWFWADECIGLGWAGKSSYSMVGRLAELQQDLIRELRD